MDEAMSTEGSNTERDQPEELGSGPLPDPDLATEPGQLGGDETVAGEDDDRR